MTTAELLEQASTILQDPEGVRFPSSYLTVLLDEAQRDFGTRTGLLDATAVLDVDVTQTPDTAFYTLPDDLQSLNRVEFDGYAISPMDKTAFPEGYEWTTVTGDPVGYMHGPWGGLTIRLYPYPTTAATTLTAYYTKMPATLATDDPVIPAAWHLALVYFAVSRAYLGNAEAADMLKAQTFASLYEDMVTKAQGNAPSAPKSIPYRHL